MFFFSLLTSHRFFRIPLKPVKRYFARYLRTITVGSTWSATGLCEAPPKRKINATSFLVVISYPELPDIPQVVINAFRDEHHKQRRLECTTAACEDAILMWSTSWRLSVRHQMHRNKRNGRKLL